ncbi:MAG: cytochrome c biogenesis protein ResB [Azonexus sp.]|nr:cytochrome c biogenesis protein ResB [Betaproteobacteria bacterium]MBK8917791.1 cytochrome c biogenesis protein ResB [Betaproteobacteria bacterium]MBP6035878.1 cytochrome c biogenesis protein ResB [Azonexus sp.]MBP6906304.1 cytochrome c biogenesis protein ResB [Azonexus sp.]
MKIAPTLPEVLARKRLSPGGWVSALGSLKLTLAILALLGITVVVTYLSEARPAWVVILPLAAAALNLAAAITSNGVFRRRLPLLVFHLCLLALILLVLAGRLTYLKGSTEVTEGTWFEGNLTAFEAGPWHGDGYRRLRFANRGFSIAYEAGLRRGPTRNAVSYVDGEGRPREAVIGDQTPLVMAGYRFYTSHNKGFAPTFAWLPAGGAEAIVGSVHLPAYPLHEYRQAQSWTLPGSGQEVWVQLVFEENPLDPDRAGEFRMPARHGVVVRAGEGRWEVGPGAELALPGGKLRYLGLRAWMGYTVHYDPTLPWLLAAAVAAVLALAAHYREKFAERPWNV